jgi:putative membrane protein
VIRLLVRAGIALAANAVGLLVAAGVLDGMHLNASGFVLAVVIFTVVAALLLPLPRRGLRERGALALGGVALLATLVSLIVTDIVSDGLDIEGVGTWVAATVIVWAVALVAELVIPFFGLRKYLSGAGSFRLRG